MSDEEKEALRNFKSEYETCDHYSSDLIIELDDAEIILNLIEKQSKEIEELKKERATEIVYVDKNFVRKDKIKAILEEYKYTEIGDSEKIIEFYKKMQSLLEKE